jgi:hypothetical protein
MLGWGRKAAVDERAKLLARMINLIMHSLKAKPYEQFVASFSNPGKEPDAFDGSNRELHFQMRISPSCWYDATATYPLRESLGCPFTAAATTSVFLSLSRRTPA